MANRLSLRFLIILIFAVAVFFRLYQFPSYPPLHKDEMAFGYTAWSFAQTGVDEFGRRPGILLESLGDWKLALYAYTVVPFVALFGLTDTAVRLPSLLFGLASVPLFFVLTRQLFGRNDVSVISALLLSVAPWHIVFSRTANESALQLCLVVGAMWLWKRYVDRGTVRDIVLSSVGMTLAFFSYYSSFLFVPLVSMLFLLCYGTARKHVLTILPLLLVVLSGILFLLTQSTSRISQTSFMQHESVNAMLVENLQESGQAAMPLLVTRGMHNKVTVRMDAFLERYGAHWDPRFLFVRGEEMYDRYSLPQHGALYVVMLPLCVVGAVYLSRYFAVRDIAFIVGWSALGFVPSSFTVEMPIFQRSIFALPGLLWLASFGIKGLLVWGYQQLLVLRLIGVGIGLVIVGYSFVHFYYTYFVHFRFRTPYYRYGHYEELLRALQQHSPLFETTFVSQFEYMPFFYYDRLPPADAQQLLKDSKTFGGGFRTLERYKGYKTMEVSCPKRGKLRVLYVCKGDVVPYHSRVIDAVRFEDGVPAYVLIEFIDPADQRVNEYKGDRIQIMNDTRERPELLPHDASTYW